MLEFKKVPKTKHEIVTKKYNIDPIKWELSANEIKWWVQTNETYIYNLQSSASLRSPLKKKKITKKDCM